MRSLVAKLALTVMVGVAAGVSGGQATVSGLVQPSRVATIGRALALPDQSMPDEQGIGQTVAYAATDHAIDDARILNLCDGCSDDELGYRFAAARRLRESAECMDFSWSYQRGCLAWLRES